MNRENLLLRVKKILRISITIISLIAVAISVFCWIYYGKSKNYQYDKLQDLELSYWSCKASIVSELENFMSSKVKCHNLSALTMLNACDKYDIDVRLPLAQGLIESHYGTKGLAKRTNSVFNLGAFDGRSLDRILGIHRYAHPNKSIEPYLKLLREQYLGDKKVEKDLLKEFVNLQGKRYASYPRYESELVTTWNEINEVTKLDSLLEVYHYLKLELNR